MSKETTKEVREVKEDLTKKVANYKIIARDSLRMQLINPRLAKLNTLEKTLKSVEEEKANYEHDVVVETYEISKLDTEHPNFEKKKESKEKTIENIKKFIEETDKEIEKIKKAIEDQKEAIQDIEHGKTLVSLEKLNELVAQMIERDAIVKVQ